jgi:hypothetical protein
MTDQPVQPEATTKAGQAMEAWLREPENYEWGRKVTNAILAIEAEARAASQERPPPITRDVLFGALLTLEPRKAGVYTIEDAARFADALADRVGVAQERTCGCQCHGPYVWDVCPHCRPDLLGVAQERPQPPTWRQPMADEPGGRRNPSYETECGECGTRLRITNNYSPQGDFLDQSTEPVGVAQERPRPDTDGALRAALVRLIAAQDVNASVGERMAATTAARAALAGEEQWNNESPESGATATGSSATSAPFATRSGDEPTDCPRCHHESRWHRIGGCVATYRTVDGETPCRCRDPESAP